MKTYRGDRTLDGIVATVDDGPLDERRDVKTLTLNGFEWGYEGEEPAQLALAILADHLGDGAEALALHELFMKGVVANFGNEWEMTGADIDTALTNLRGQAARTG